MKALIITDSLGLPREEISCEKTWTYKFMSNLSEKKYTFYTFMQRSATTNVLKKLRSHFDYLCPDLVIIQLGICDCTRRAVPRNLVLLKKIIINERITSILKFLINHYIYLFTFLIKKQDVSSGKYYRNLKSFINFIHNSREDAKIVLCAIADPGIRFRNKVYKIQDDVKEYNDLLKKLSEENENVIYLDWNNGYNADDYVLELDGHHLNEFGNELFYTKLSKIVGGVIYETCSNYWRRQYWQKVSSVIFAYSRAI